LGAVERYEVVDDYAERVRRARQRLGLTQKELAQRVKVSENVIKRIEAGTLVPTIDLARRLERVLGVKLLEPVVEEETEVGSTKRGREEFYLTLGDIAEIRED
jgi:putative transcription factor